MAGKATPGTGSPSTGAPAEGSGADLPKVPGTPGHSAGSVAVQEAPPRVKARSFSVAPPRLPAPAVVATAAYRVGTLDRAPIFTFTSPVSGVRFVRRTGRTNDKGGYESEVPGQIVRLSEAQRDKTLEQVAQHVVRMVGGQPHVLHVDAAHYRAEAGDVPLGAYLFMHEVPLDADGNALSSFYIPNPEPLYRGA